MNATRGVLAMVSDPALRDDMERVAAAAGEPVVHASEPSSRRVWTAAVLAGLPLLGVALGELIGADPLVFCCPAAPAGGCWWSA